MLIRYKRNRRTACYESESLLQGGRPEPAPQLTGPFKSCGGCPYARNGFICWSSEGKCLKTDMNRKLRTEVPEC